MARFSITSKNYYRLALLSPYITWGFFTLIIFLTKDLLYTETGWFSTVFGVIVFSIFFWLVPYTIIIVGLLIWSMIANTNKFITAINFSPLMLATVIWISLITGNSVSKILTQLGSGTFLAEWLFLAVISIVIGYVFVVIFHGVHRLLKNKNIIVES